MAPPMVVVDPIKVEIEVFAPEMTANVACVAPGVTTAALAAPFSAPAASIIAPEVTLVAAIAVVVDINAPSAVVVVFPDVVVVTPAVVVVYNFDVIVVVVVILMHWIDGMDGQEKGQGQYRQIKVSSADALMLNYPT